MKVPLLDLKAQYDALRDELRPVVDDVLESQRFIMGPEVEALENEIAAYCHCQHAVGVSSGTDALLAALMALEIGPGDEVVTSPYTFFATAGVVHRLGGRSVFVDIERDSFNLDPNLLEKAISPRTKTIIPVHLFGQCAEMDPILEIAASRNIPVIEDAAQAIGSEYKGRRAGSMGVMGCFSFFPSKNLGGFGDGGMITAENEALRENLAILRMHGSKPKYYHRIVGGNFRLDALQAAVLRVKLRHLDDWSAKRQLNANRYNRLFNEKGLAGTKIHTPAVKQNRHIYNQYVIRVERRDELKEHLLASGIGVEVYYPVPLHQQECFAYLGYKPGDFPQSEEAALTTIALPIYPELNEEQQAYVVDRIAAFYD